MLLLQLRKLRPQQLARIVSEQYAHRGWPLTVDPDSMFDCQVKRIHEYKRQLLNVLHAVRPASAASAIHRPRQPEAARARRCCRRVNPAM